ncbi:MAG: hypothetical protein SOH99_00570 [Acidipropionibacterium acidipropionici]|jgi:hypothetical protein|uniref:Uncharacterized protein n=2 Tax=Acidipropionibacterium acidipropionici TaxID=1748 RepID=A0A142KGS7_9ACTN|nr:hypothetical protein [Acidipropionibacterium acidipropionici]AFV90644.1 hypothetical protein PACID_28770 [Acidipropionibacterium acidipropionici ATCC 4875]ALN15175.1 hypothetical protein ASQ49_07700 [Acidipropionibacterium acidipropionici]AMS05315.1 hypothetical protein AXH35_07440 [Acidipropionibacterium acidipropionici]AOZ46794.1 hypothetical protein A8L58_08895 [Acidipropionibacterium acidipropionici]APZ09076.1 hypothetical protein BWX38_07220 [Acidipropionibacterium acidipropionici]
MTNRQITRTFSRPQTVDIHGVSNSPGAWALMHDLGDESSDEFIMIPIRFIIGIARDCVSGVTLMRRRVGIAMLLLLGVALRLGGVTGVGGSLYWLHIRSGNHAAGFSSGTRDGIIGLAAASIIALVLGGMLASRVRPRHRRRAAHA